MRGCEWEGEWVGGWWVFEWLSGRSGKREGEGEGSRGGREEGEEGVGGGREGEDRRQPAAEFQRRCSHESMPVGGAYTEGGPAALAVFARKEHGATGLVSGKGTPAMLATKYRSIGAGTYF